MFNPFTPLLLLATTALTTAALTPPPAILTPWQITSLGTHSPSGRPAGHPYSQLAFSIHDPNTITVGTTPYGNATFPPLSANCTVVWMSYGPDPREEGLVTACDDGGQLKGRWTFEVLEGEGEGGGSATADFGLRVRLEETVVLGTGAAKENAPVLVKQELEAMECVVGDCDKQWDE
ncbi:predicted protein [Chaetomium globosum CBS 148.51]|uniref:Lipocalin-like domain-containing protein n=1 Tax=Chaetomium globosum (strain ATCC 6205 / CBS 148.51 / DSM 1962 / NBRC 6347 / NRRL 1970) TaxID=306901 RepID=Q2H7I2_CHAGB|nr:uncharacterized protein CHGG_05383 [Chaetomium globosum CBS 148.51]EAQ88764.1 predicted protein [Chaetomium globosum CBS 148.51]